MGALHVLRDFTVSLVTIILFPLAWVRAMRVAKAHSDDDPKAPARVLTGIVVGVLLCAGGIYVTTDFHQENVDGIHESLVKRLSIRTGNEDYKGYVDARDQANATLLADHHSLFLGLESILAEPGPDADEAAKALIGLHAASLENNDAFAFDKEHVLESFTIKDEAVHALGQVMAWLVYPGLVGALFGPVFIALGTVLKHAFNPSTSVGFKPYPGGSLGLFLILGAFGVPATLFAAWGLMDVRSRSLEGQIAL